MKRDDENGGNRGLIRSCLGNAAKPPAQITRKTGHIPDGAPLL
jgi:hypothetical protein